MPGPLAQGPDMIREERMDLKPERAVAYYRCATQSAEEDPISMQREQVRQFAQEHGIEIVREFVDRCKSGLTTEGRHDFTEMVQEYIIGAKEDFLYVLTLDPARLGRFRDPAQMAYYVSLCRKHGKLLVFVALSLLEG